VAFVDAVERTWLEELGGMNIMAITDTGELHTPELTGTILPGVTRDALLQLAREDGLTVVERRLSVGDLLADIDAGRVTELFACGTAAIITPIKSLTDAAGTHVVGDGTAGEATLRLRRTLTDVQSGHRDDEHGWMYPLA